VPDHHQAGADPQATAPDSRFWPRRWTLAVAAPLTSHLLPVQGLAHQRAVGLSTAARLAASQEPRLAGVYWARSCLILQ